ncbi:MAG: hypothetical protein V8R40_05185 [Dysosmobacter sp.]
MDGRKIQHAYAKKIKTAEDVDFHKIARMASRRLRRGACQHHQRSGTPGGAQWPELCHPIRLGGKHRSSHRRLSEEERHPDGPGEVDGFLYHEIGHALVAAKQTHSAPVQKITIIPRTSGALGYTMQVEEGNRSSTREELENKIATYTGGRAAEEVVFGTISTGASNDIEQATKLARSMITRYGMSKDFDMVAMETVSNQYLGGDSSLTCSMETQTEIDRQVVALVKAA